MEFKDATVTFTGEWYSLSTRIGLSAEDFRNADPVDLDEEVKNKAVSFFEEFYGWKLGNTWFSCDITYFDEDGNEAKE